MTLTNLSESNQAALIEDEGRPDILHVRHQKPLWDVWRASQALVGRARIIFLSKFYITQIKNIQINCNIYVFRSYNIFFFLKQITPNLDRGC